MFLVTISFVFGVICMQQVSRLPEPEWVILLLLGIAILFRYRPLRPAGWFLLGWTWALITAGFTLQDQLDPALEGKDLLVEGRVIGIPQSFDRGIRFGFKIDRIDGITDERFPGKVRLSWYYPPVRLEAGEGWSFPVRMKRPHGTLNPGGFDYEQWLYLQGYRATGYIRRNPAARRLERPEERFSIDKIRQSIAERLTSIFNARPIGAIIQALVVGERHEISEAQWEVFRKTGTSHLIAISGLHVGLVATFAFFIGQWIWLRIGTLRIPAPPLAASFAILCSVLYSALAGFSVPTRRALIMITLIMGAIILRRKVIKVHTIAVALLLIVLLDPASVLSPGLWLSFAAVALIVYTLAGRAGPNGTWFAMKRVHIATAIGLAPLLLLYFQQVSLVAPLANFVAVPIVSLLAVPACLVGSLLLMIPKVGVAFLSIGALTLELLWVYLEWLADLPFAQWSGSPPSWVALVLAVAGLALSFAPRGVPARWLAVPMLLSVIIPSNSHPEHGQFDFTLLDVGQGLSAVVETSGHTLVFDTGPRLGEHFNMGSAVVAPFLRSRNIDAVHRLIVSHADNDHLGGASTLDKLIRIDEIYTSAEQSIDWRRAEECKADQHWNWDGVEFEMLAPLDMRSSTKNERSCVLKIGSGTRSILLTGDIERNTEKALIQHYGARLKSDYLIVPHHGSNTSSTAEFLEAVRPLYALIPAGYRNRFGFPRPEVVERLEQADARIYNTADSGAILIPVQAEEPRPAPIRYRTISRKYYHTGPEDTHGTNPSLYSRLFKFFTD